VLRDKRASGEGLHGELVALSSRIGRIRAASPVAAMAHVKIEIREDGLIRVELWGTTVAQSPSAGDASFDVWSMSIPEPVRAAILSSTTSRTE